MNARRVLLAAVICTVLIAASAPAASCPESLAINTPTTACRLGSATAAVAPIEGATYAWSVTGGTIVSGNGTPQILLTFGNGTSAQIAVAVSGGGCSSSGQATINLREAFAVNITADPGRVAEPVTIRWNFTGGVPASQALNGTDFPLPLALPADARSYTYTPATPGAKEAWIAATASFGSALPPPPGARRRAAGRGGEPPTSCVTSRKFANYQIDECVKPAMWLESPRTVFAGKTFDVQAHTDATAIHWTITNGTPATADGSFITIRAGDSGAVGFTATASRGSCPHEASESGSVTIAAEASCDHPVAVVSAGPSGCGGGTVNVTFQGTPPFSGTWSDGQTFTSNATTMSRHVTATGSYSITHFEDQTCAGTASGSASFDFYGPRAVITANGSCSADTVTVQFTGTPPFVGRWSDNESFSTNAMSMQRRAATPGKLTISYFDDANCRGLVSGVLDVKLSPTLSVRSDWPVDPNTNCYPYPAGPGLQNEVGMALDFDGYGTPPFTATWADGTVTTGSAWPLRRYALTPDTTTYTVVSAHDANCAAILVNPSVTFWISQRPSFTVDGLDPIDAICDHVSTTAHLDNPPKPGTTINWTVQNGTITAGQGTPTVTFTSGTNGPGSVTCDFTFNDKRCPISANKAIFVDGIPPAPQVSISPSTIKAGGTAMITYTLFRGTALAYAGSSRAGDFIDGSGTGCQNNVCQAVYHANAGAGTATITVYVRGYCDQPNSGSATVTVEP